MKWLPEYDEALKGCLEQRMSSAQAADVLSRQFRLMFTRNSTIGRAFRLGLTTKVTKADGSRIRYEGKPKVVSPTPKPRPRPKPRHFACEPVTGLRVADVVPLHISLLDLEPDQCRWPYGDSQFTFCGRGTFDGSSYCEPHQALSLRADMQGVNFDQTTSQRAAHRKVIVPAVAALAREYGSEGEAA